jgi:hypothetical protein
LFIQTDEKWHSGFEVSEYNGKYYLTKARQYTDREGNEKVAQTWGELEIGKDKTKHLPVSVELGMGKEAAIKALEGAIEYLKGEEDVPF